MEKTLMLAVLLGCLVALTLTSEPLGNYSRLYTYSNQFYYCGIYNGPFPWLKVTKPLLICKEHNYYKGVLYNQPNRYQISINKHWIINCFNTSTVEYGNSLLDDGCHSAPFVACSLVHVGRKKLCNTERTLSYHFKYLKQRQCIRTSV